jgi:hypothetical protein
LGESCGERIGRSIGERDFLMVSPSENSLPFVESIEEKKLDPEDRLG